MIRKKIFIPMVILALMFTGVFLAYGDDVMAASSNLSWGSRGDQVVQVQETLNNRGYWAGTADGIFGSKTYNAVISFQKDAGLLVDGIVGPQTRGALGIATANISSNVSRGGARTITVVATAYTDAPEENWPWVGYPSYIGLPLARGIVAVDPNVIPMGSKLYIEGYGEGIAADQGGAIKGSRIDLFMDTKAEAYAWGMRTVKVTVY